MPESSAAQLSVLLVLAQSTGGIGRHVKMLAAGLPARGVSVTVCAPPQSIEALGLDRRRRPVVAAPLGDGRPVALRRHPGAALRSAAGGVDLVHAHGLRAGADCVGVPARVGRWS